jgi:hypothetical protein
MTKWQYGLAYFTDGLIEAHADYMNDMEAGPQEIFHFLEEAGELGWELCTLLPHQKLCLVFKRPL